MILAHAAHGAEIVEADRLVAVFFKVIDGADQPAPLPRHRRGWSVGKAGNGADDDIGRRDRRFVGLGQTFAACMQQGLDDGRGEIGAAWQHRDREAEAVRAGGGGRNLFEQRGVEMKRDATVADPVIVPAFEARAGIAEKKGARVEQRRACARPALEQAIEHDGDRRGTEPLFLGPVLRSEPADDVVDRPASAGRDRPCRRSAGGRFRRILQHHDASPLPELRS